MGRDDRATMRRDSLLAFDGMKAAMKDRDGTTFVALPHVVIDSAGWRQAAPMAKALLLELAAPMNRNGRDGTRGLPNGGLMVERDRLRLQGWKSVDVINRALNDLVRCGLMVETRKGGKNLPSLYAVTWHGLGVDDSYQLDIDRKKWGSVYRGAYSRPNPIKAEKEAGRANRAASARLASAARSASAAAKKIASSSPSHGQQRPATRPLDGQLPCVIGPPNGLVAVVLAPGVGPSNGHSIEGCHLSEQRAACLTSSVPGRPAQEDGVVDNRASASPVAVKSLNSLMAIAQRSAAMRQLGLDPVLGAFAADPSPANRPADNDSHSVLIRVAPPHLTTMQTQESTA